MNNLIENNRLIGIFMGGETKEMVHPWIAMFISNYEINFQENNYPETPHNGSCWNFNELKYHENWNWLMPVMEKIESLGYDTRIKTHLPIKHLCSVNDNHSNLNICEVSSSKIEAVWLAIVEFIKWYNKNEQ